MAYVAAARAARGPLASFVAMGVNWGTFMASMPDIRERLAVDDGRMGVLLIFGSIAAITCMSLTPRFGSRLGRWGVPVFTLFMALALFAQAQGTSPLAFVLALMCMGAATGALDVLMNARLADIEVRRGLAIMNLAHGMYSLGFGVAALATAWLRAQGLGAGDNLMLASGVVMLCALVSYEADGAVEGLGDTPGGARPPAMGWVPVLGGVLILTAIMAENAVEAWSAVFIERDLAGGVGAGSIGPALLGFTMGAGRLAGQGLIVRMGAARLMTLGICVSTLGILGVITAQSVPWAYVGFAVMGLGGSVLVPTALDMVRDRARPGTRSRAIAWATVIGYGGFFLGPPILGLVASLVGLRGSFMVLAVVVAASLFALRALLRPRE